VFMMAAVATIAGVVVLEARPVYAYLGARWTGRAPSTGELVLGFGLAAALCLAAAVVPLRVAVARLERLDS